MCVVCGVAASEAMRGSTPLDVAAASCIDNNELALALQEQELEKVCVHTRLHMHVGRGCEVVSQIRL